MCKIVEDYAKEYAKEYAEEVVLEKTSKNIKKLFENGCNLDMAIASFESVPEELIRKLYEEVIGKKALV